MQDIREELQRHRARAHCVLQVRGPAQAAPADTEAAHRRHGHLHPQEDGNEHQQGRVLQVLDNSNRVKWSVASSGGQNGMVPGAIFTIPPPNQEAIDAVEKLKR